MRCVDCDGSQICEHRKRRENCADCGGSAICEHLINKRYCKLCGGSQICEHGRKKAYCRDCDGSAFCEHSLRKTRCQICSGSELCEHNKRKHCCILCTILTSLHESIYISIYHAIGIDYLPKWRELLGCSIEEYKDYLDTKLEPWMTWENYGVGPYKWYIYYSIPIEFGGPTLEIKITRFHYRNTIPMRSMDAHKI